MSTESVAELHNTKKRDESEGSAERDAATLRLVRRLLISSPNRSSSGPYCRTVPGDTACTRLYAKVYGHSIIMVVY